MDFVDWRKKKSGNEEEQKAAAARSVRRRLNGSYIDEAIREAQARGEFDNLPGAGKPLDLEEHFAAGENSLAYGLLRSNNSTLPQLELIKEIDARKEQIEKKRIRLSHQGKSLRQRQFPPSEQERQAYNTAVAKALAEYEQELRSINNQILSLNLSVPETLHRTPFNISEQIKRFQKECPLFLL